MSVLTISELSDHRQQLYKDIPESARPFSKPQLHAALQAVENLFESSARAALGSAIETAAPGIFTAQQKAFIVKAWLFVKFMRGG